MRIRLHTGHERGLNVTLREASKHEFNEDEPFVQFGIGCFIEFYGEKLEKTFIDVNTDEDFFRQARLLAQAAELFGVPYLLGQGKDFFAIQETYKKSSNEAVEEIKRLQLPSFVQKRWHLPKDNFNDK